MEGNEAFNQLEAAPKVRVWDLPTRLFHWVLVIVIAASFITGKVGGNAIDWHLRLGMLAMAMLAFRLVWGLIGGRWSRFASFVFSPRTIVDYVRGTHVGPAWRLDVGHSPTGALSVFAMLIVLIAQVATGLVADDEIATTGPLYRFVSSAVSGRATGWHTGWGQGLIIALVILHIAAIIYYVRVKRRALVAAMVSGDKRIEDGVGGVVPAHAVEASRDTAITRVIALVVFVVCFMAAQWVFSLGR